MSDPLAPDAITALIERLREATTVLDEPFHQDAIGATLIAAADALSALSAQAEKLNHWHRRAQKAEAELCLTAEARERQGQSIGRRLAGATWQHYKDRAEVAEAKVVALSAQTETAVREATTLVNLEADYRESERLMLRQLSDRLTLLAEKGPTT